MDSIRGSGSSGGLWNRIKEAAESERGQIEGRRNELAEQLGKMEEELGEMTEENEQSASDIKPVGERRGGCRRRTEYCESEKRPDTGVSESHKILMDSLRQ